MLEAEFTKEHVRPACSIILGQNTQIKHSDQFTSGVPDLTVTAGGRTFWLESKVHRKGDASDLLQEIRNRRQLLQYEMLRALHRDSLGKAIYVIRDERESVIYWCEPDTLLPQDRWRFGPHTGRAAVLECLGQYFTRWP